MAMRARDMRGGAIAAAIFMATAGGCAIWVHMATPEYSEPQKITPLMAGVLTGSYAGWFHLSRKLGRGYIPSGLFGVGAGLIAFLIFAVLTAVRTAYYFHQAIQFESARQALFFVLDATVNVFRAALSEHQAVLTLLALSFAAGVFSEALNRLWR